MASIFSDSEKSAIESLLDDVHDTFKNNIFVYVEEITTVADNNDTDLNNIDSDESLNKNTEQESVNDN